MKSLAVCLGITLFATGCGGGGSSKPQPISGAAKQVADVVQRLEKATETKNFAAICNDILASSARKQAGGDACPAVLGARVRDVSHPRIKIESIEIDGPTAQAKVRTTATGQAPTTDVIRLVRENGEYRVISLGG